MQSEMRPFRARLSRRPTVAAISAVIALFAAVLAHGTVKPVAAASTHVFVDTTAPSAIHRAVIPDSALEQRTELLGRVVTSPPAIADIARRVGVPASQIAADARFTGNVPAAFKEPQSEERATEILGSGLPYRIEVGARQTTPVLDIYTHAPTTVEAVRLADAAVADLVQRLRRLGDNEGLASSDQIVLRQLGATRGGIVNGGMAIAIGLLAFIVAFASAYAALRYLGRDRAPSPRPRRLDGPAGDAWPHTGRLVPWMFAIFMAMVWLMPFDAIVLDVSAPIDLTLDRLVLPIVIATLVMAWLAGGRMAPRLRLTRIHAAVAAFVLCAFLSVILNAALLNQTLELAGAVKRLPLLVSYVLVFVVASTAIRSREVRPFLTYTLVISVICAVGVLWEYRFKHNLFFEWSDKLLPSIFKVGKADSTSVDELGRRMVRGPAAVPLETVAMLAMALPIPLVRLMQSERWRERILYGLAVCLLFAAAFATFRKSALLAPLSAVATVAYFRRRELLKLAPLALVLVVITPILAPGAVRLTAGQLEPGRLGVATVSDRTADYDAVRPDVWSHVLLGRGFGSYDHVTYRILDSEILNRLIETGVVGLLAFLFMVVSVVWAARSTIAERDRTWAPMALSGAAAAVSFVVASTLFDIMGFAHAVYIFLCIAGLVATVVSHHREEYGTAPEGRARLARAPEPAPPEVARGADRHDGQWGRGAAPAPDRVLRSRPA